MENMGAALSWIAGMIPQVYAAALQPLGIDGRHLAVLLTLQRTGPQVQAHLSQISRIDKATMVSLLNELAEGGSIERRPHPSDRRAYEVHLTPQGAALIQQAKAATQQATDDLLAALSPAERQHLHEMLVRIAEHVTPADYVFGQPLLKR
jgi:DNA-binding MarR family transcriptional regulator